MSLKWRTLLLLAFAELAVMSLWLSASAVVPLLTLDWILDDNGRAWLTLSVQLGFVVGAFLSALLNLADIMPTSVLFTVAALIAAGANAAIAFGVSEIWGALALRFITGFCLAGVYPVGMKIMATWCKEDRGLGIGLLVGALTLGTASPHLVNALGGLSDWRVVLYVASLLALAGAVICILLVREGPLSSKSPPFNWKMVGTVWRERGLRLANFGYFGHMWEIYGMWTWIPLFLTASFAASGILDAPRWGAFAAFAAIGVGGIGSLLAGVWADRWGRTRVAILALVISGACCVLSGIFFYASPWLVLVLALVWGIAVVADSAQYSASISELAPREYIGTALTLQTSIGFLLTMLTIRLTPTLASVIGWQWAFAFLAIGPVFGIWAMWVLMKSSDAKKLANGRG